MAIALLLLYLRQYNNPQMNQKTPQSGFITMIVVIVIILAVVIWFALKRVAAVQH